MRKRRYLNVRNMSVNDRTELRVRIMARLKLNGGNIKRTSRETNVSVSTIRTWLRGKDPATLQYARERAELLVNATVEKKDQIAAEAEAKQAEIVAAATDTVISLSMDKMIMLANELIESMRISLGKEQKFSDRSWAFMVLFDKIQVMQGNPTAIRETLSRGMNREQREERMEALMRSAEERRQQMKLVAGQVKDVTNDG